MTAPQKPADTAANRSPDSYRVSLRALRFRLRRLWKLPSGYKTTPALFGIIMLTMTSLGVTLTGWVMVRLLPNVELIRKLAAEFPDGFFELVRSLPELLAATSPSSTSFTGVIVSQEAYIITYACGAATVFCFILLMVVLLRRW